MINALNTRLAALIEIRLDAECSAIHSWNSDKSM